MAKKRKLQVKKMEPHTAVGNLIKPRVDKGQDPVSRREAVAAKARNNPKERFNSLLHHLTYDLIADCLQKTPLSSAVGVDEMTVEQARENLPQGY